MEAAADRGDVEDEVGGSAEPFEPPDDDVPGVDESGVDERGVREPSVLDEIQDDLDGVEEALRRLDEGSYGTCEACGAAIDDEVLAGRPTAHFCSEHEVASGVTRPGAF